MFSSSQTQVIFSTYTASRNPKYVEDPTSFRPERWTRDSAESIDPFVSLPFGFGSRMCYGNNRIYKGGGGGLHIYHSSFSLGRRLVELELYILLSKVNNGHSIEV